MRFASIKVTHRLVGNPPRVMKQSSHPGDYQTDDNQNAKLHHVLRVTELDAAEVKRRDQGEADGRQSRSNSTGAIEAMRI